MKGRNKTILKDVPKFDGRVLEPVTRDPAKVVKKFRDKEAATFVTKTLPKMHKQCMDIFRVVLHGHQQLLRAYENEEVTGEASEWMSDMLDRVGALCLDNVAHMFYEQRSITARQLGYQTMTDLRDMAEGDEAFFDKKDIEDIRTHQNFQWDINRILRREKSYNSRRNYSYNRNRGRYRQNRNRGGFGRPWRQNFYQNDRNSNSYGDYQNKNRNNFRHTGSRRGRGRGF